MSLSVLLAGQKALALMLHSATDLLGRKHMFSHEVFDLLEDGLSFQRLSEQGVICSRSRRPGGAQAAGEKLPSVPLSTFIRLTCF